MDSFSNVNTMIDGSDSLNINLSTHFAQALPDETSFLTPELSRSHPSFLSSSSFLTQENEDCSSFTTRNKRNQLAKPTQSSLFCIICGKQLSSVFKYHKHNINVHTSAELSRAILKLRNLQTPQIDPGKFMDIKEFESDDDNNLFNSNMYDSLLSIGDDFYLKPDGLDEEVIELGPTDSSDILKIQSRSVVNRDKVLQRSQQIIELKENHQILHPLSSMIDYQNSVVVKYDTGILTTIDSMNPIVNSDNSEKTHSILRASFKSYINEPNCKSYMEDFQKSFLEKTDNYSTNKYRKRCRVEKHKQSLGSKTYDHDDDDDAFTFNCDDNDDDDSNTSEKEISTQPIRKSRKGRIIKQPNKNVFMYYNKSEDSSQNLRSEHHLNKKVRSNATTISTDSIGNEKCVDNKSKIILECNKVPNDSKVENIDGTHENFNFDLNSIEYDKMLDESSSDLKDNIKTNTFDVHDFKKELKPPKLDELKSSNNNSENKCMKDIEYVDGSKFCLADAKRFSSSSDSKSLIQQKVKDLIPKKINEGSSSNADAFSCKDKNSQINSPFSEDKSSNKNKSKINYINIQNKVENNLKSSKSKSKSKKLFSCEFCEKVFYTKFKLNCHFKRYHEDTKWMTYKCGTCGKSFGFLLALERHMKEHNPNKSFCCEVCGKVFKCLRNLKSHMDTHLKEEVYTCSFCTKKYYVKLSYVKHLKSHTNERKFFCSLCEKHFNEKCKYENHLFKHENGGILGRSKDLRCNYCGDIQTKESIIENVDDGGHHKTCLKCGKGLYKYYFLKNENSNSKLSNPKPQNQCKICGKWVINVNRHIKNVHVNNEYVSCEICNIIIAKASLPAHKDRKHGASTVTCDHCNKTFKSVIALGEHMSKIKHKTNSLKNVCLFCKKHVSPNEIEGHMKEHEIKCEDCGLANFQSYPEFLNHLDVCRKCSNCKRCSFLSRDDFLNHIESCSKSNIDLIPNTFSESDNEDMSILGINSDYTCHFCGQIFCNDQDLDSHIALHA